MPAGRSRQQPLRYVLNVSAAKLQNRCVNDMLNKLHLGKIVLAHIATDVKANGNKLDIKQNTDCILIPDFG